MLQEKNNHKSLLALFEFEKKEKSVFNNKSKNKFP